MSKKTKQNKIKQIKNQIKEIKNKIKIKIEFECTITASSDLSIVKKYVKELNNIDLNDIMSSQLSQSKLYLKILKVSYFLENINLPITFNVIEMVIKNTYILMMLF